MNNLDKLLEVMARLRDPKTGCPWDLEQDFASIAPHTIEEAYEVADAIGKGDMRELQEELGDLLFQVVFHAHLAAEQGEFDFYAVAGSISKKLTQRHPHVFGDAESRDSAEQTRQWEEHKAGERRSKGQHSVLDGIPVALPALSKAQKLGQRAATAGFDWPDRDGPRRKIDEEMVELDSELDNGSARRQAEEIGDLLFSVVNLARHLDVDAETALREANRRFATRFQSMETRLQESGQKLSELSLSQLELAWQKAKKNLRGG
ncbi:MAG: nucleoside triphosphate pyrophosphohydrolase [Proteobacteria bacterium]|nr:nucleoside triphosphate pyrophosphohydrolase [Pseudomonadota bacterium]MCH9026056.1 nucleoside triphosphate pyrophosphohydrolase [Pseudomonadota bacterium]